MRGSLKISGSSNQVTKAIIATILTDESVFLHNTPLVSERDSVLSLFEELGGTFEFLTDRSLRLNAKDIRLNQIPQFIAQKNRIAVLTLAPLLHRFGRVSLPKSLGGDVIGSRPVDFHLNALQKMGASLKETDDFYELFVQGELQGAFVTLPFPSVMTTETVLLASVKAKGRSVIQNAAIEPEVLALVRMLQTMGADITYTANRTFIVEGQKKMKGTTCYLIPDRNEAISYACLVLAAKGEVFLEGLSHEMLFSFLNVIQRMGAEFEVTPQGLYIRRYQDLKGVFVETEVHPGFMTDWQQPFSTVLTQAQGVSLVHETIFESRLSYTEDLVKMGANINLYSKCLGEAPCRFKNRNHLHSAVIIGPTPLEGQSFHLRTDIRSGMALVIAGAVAKGITFLSNIQELERKYENLLGQLNHLGVDASWVCEEEVDLSQVSREKEMKR